MMMIFIRYKSVSISVKGREHQKRTQSPYQTFKRLSESGEFVFCVQLGLLEKIVAWTGPYRTGLNIYAGMCIYVCMYVCTYVFVYVFTYANMYVYLCMYVCSYVFMNADMCVSISPNHDDIYYI